MRNSPPTSPIQNLIKMHFNTFIHTGRIPFEILYDNMKQVVIDKKIGASESKFNFLFLQFSQHCGFDVRLCYPTVHRERVKLRIQ
jgi:transposase